MARTFDARLVEAVEILRDVWGQFAVPSTNPDARDGKWAGGLSTLEWVDEFLSRFEADLKAATESRKHEDS